MIPTEVYLLAIALGFGNDGEDPTPENSQLAMRLYNHLRNVMGLDIEFSPYHPQGNRIP